MKKINSVRQGDMAAFRLKKVPEGYEKTDQTTLEIRGERGGHIHRITGVEVHQPAGGTAVAERPDVGPEAASMIPVAVIRAFEPTTVTHDVLGDNEEPHPDRVLPPGIWEVRRARQRRSRETD